MNKSSKLFILAEGQRIEQAQSGLRVRRIRRPIQKSGRRDVTIGNSKGQHHKTTALNSFAPGLSLYG
jgi:hypothetical protein